MAQIARLGPYCWLRIPIRGLNRAHDLGQPCTISVRRGWGLVPLGRPHAALQRAWGAGSRPRGARVAGVHLKRGTLPIYITVYSPLQSSLNTPELQRAAAMVSMAPKGWGATSRRAGRAARSEALAGGISRGWRSHSRAPPTFHSLILHTIRTGGTKMSAHATARRDRRRTRHHEEPACPGGRGRPSSRSGLPRNCFWARGFF